MQPVNTGGSIVWCHYGSEYPFSLGYGTRSWVGDLDIFWPESSLLLVEACFGPVADALLLAAWPGRAPTLERLAQADAERVFLVGKLVDEITGVAPKREVRVGLGGVEGGAGALLVVVVVQQMGCVAASLASRGGKRVKWNVGRPPVVRVGRNLEGWRLVGAALLQVEVGQRQMHVTGPSARNR